MDMVRSQHSITNRFVALALALAMPFCCCVVNAAVPATASEGTAEVVRSCCSSGGIQGTDRSNPDSTPADGRCGCIKLFGTVDLGIDDLLVKLSLPTIAHDASPPMAITLPGGDPVRLRPPSRAGPDRDDGNVAQRPRDLRQRLMLQV